ncbi:hypothetical protein BV25DRAFT_408075, partial [Artomyces pyxidatus]
MSDFNPPSLQPLSNTNYPQWAAEMAAWLRLKGVWLLVKGEETIPDPSEVTERLRWKDKASRAAGALFLAVQFDQRGHLAGLEDDPV